MFPKDEILLEIESLALSGEGIARRDGLVYFVEDAFPGEEVRTELVKPEKNLIRTKALEILRKSPDRAEPVCGHFGSCGGCAFQHLSYERQLEFKRNALQELFDHLGGFRDVPIEPMIPSPKPFHYRNTVAMSVRHQRGEPYLGFIGRDNRSFIPINHCPITEEKLNGLLSEVRQEFKSRIPLEKRRQISQIVIRIGQSGEVYTSLKKSKDSPTLSANVDGKTFHYSGSSFFQVNFSILEAFVAATKKFLEPSFDANLLDLYCGVGLFGICLAGRYGRVLGIEEGEEAVFYARENAKTNGVANTEFVLGRAEEALSQIPDFFGEKLHVILDPPRIGMKKEAIQFLLKLPKIERIVYVSCNPATLIRDLKLFSPRFRIEKIQPLDLFPQTKHLETIVLLLPS